MSGWTVVCLLAFKAVGHAKQVGRASYPIEMIFVMVENHRRVVVGWSVLEARLIMPGRLEDPHFDAIFSGEQLLVPIVHHRLDEDVGVIFRQVEWSTSALH